MACDSVIITREVYEKRPNEKELKQSIYSPTLITDEILTNLFSSEESNIAQRKELFEGENAILPYRSVRDKTRNLRYFEYEKSMPFGERIGVITDGTDIRDITIALTQLIAMGKSESDLTRKYNLSKAELEQVGGEGNAATAYSNAARTIGREILKTRGYRLVPTSPEGVQKAIAYETNIGEKAIQKLIDRDLVNVNDNGTVVNRGFKKPDPTSPRNTSYLDKKGKRTSKLVDNVKTIVLKDIYGPKLEEDIEGQREVTGKLASVRALINPSNAAIPGTEAKEVNKQAQDMNILDTDEAILEQAQKSPLAISPLFKTILTEL